MCEEVDLVGLEEGLGIFTKDELLIQLKCQPGILANRDAIKEDIGFL